MPTAVHYQLLKAWKTNKQTERDPVLARVPGFQVRKGALQRDARSH